MDRPSGDGQTFRQWTDLQAMDRPSGDGQTMEAHRGPRPGNMRQWQLHPMGLLAAIGSIPVVELALDAIGQSCTAWRKSGLEGRWVGPVRIVRRRLQVDRRRLVDFGNSSNSRRLPMIGGITMGQALGALDARDEGQGRKERKECKEHGCQGR